jgi:hypothetical protein
VGQPRDVLIHHVLLAALQRALFLHVDQPFLSQQGLVFQLDLLLQEVVLFHFQNLVLKVDQALDLLLVTLVRLEQVATAVVLHVQQD